MRVAVAIIGEGFGEALRASRVIRNASIYVGILFVALAGAGVMAEIGIVTWASTFRAASQDILAVALERVNGAQFLVLAGILGCEIVLIDGTAIALTLLGGRILGASVTLRAAIQRARQVFWRLVGVGLTVALAQLVVSMIYRIVIGAAAVGPGTGATFYRIEPIPGAIVAIPFVLATTSIVVADDSIGGALRRSAVLARRAPWLVVALSVFSLLLGYIGLFSLGSGWDILGRVVTAIHLDIRAGSGNFIITVLLGLAFLSALGSILFTVGAIMSAAQVTAVFRLGVPTAGLARVMDIPTSPAAPDPGDGVGVVRDPVANDLWDADGIEPPDPPDLAEPPEPPATAISPTATPAGAVAASISTRRITVPMRLFAAFLWISALVSVMSGAPH